MLSIVVVSTCQPSTGFRALDDLILKTTLAAAPWLGIAKRIGLLSARR
jgi:hypothetical protein